jgi:phosphatidylglycerol---prolipoprotein diacylglyceryl transferase
MRGRAYPKLTRRGDARYTARSSVHPILIPFRPGPETVRTMAMVASVLLSLFIVWDGKKKMKWALVQAFAFFAVSFSVAYFFVTADRLPAQAPFDIRSWGVFVVVGMVTCFLIQRKLGKEVGLTGDQILSLWVYGGLGAAIGARGLHVAVNWSWYKPNPISALFFMDGGMVYIGGVVGALIVGIVYALIKHLSIRAFDVVAIGIALTQGLGRIGCFLAGCCYGQPTDLPIGVRFGEGSIVHYTMLQTGELAPGATHTMPLHPTQLYEALACFVIGSVLLYWYRKKMPRPGLVICGYFMLYSFARFFLEMVRNDPERQFYFGFSTSQLAGMVLFAIALAVAALLTVVKPEKNRLAGAVANHDV